MWRHHQLDFSHKAADPFILVGSFEATDGRGGKKRYRVEAGKRGEHLMMFYEPCDHERPSVIIYPFFKVPGRNCGVVFGVNWDGRNFFGKAILSDGPLTGLEAEGTIDRDRSSDLDEIWNSEFAQGNRVPSDMFLPKRRSRNSRADT